MSQRCLPSLIVLFLLAAGSSRAATLVSRPQQATLFRDGTAVLVEKLESSAATATIELPAAADPSSVRVRAGSTLVGGLQIEAVYEQGQGVERSVVGGVVVEKTVEKKELAGYRLRLDPIRAKAPLTLRYTVSGLSWTPRVEAELVDDKRVSVVLMALVVNQAVDLKGCKLQLASSAGQLPSKQDFGLQHALVDQNVRAADLIYESGTQTISKDRTALLTVLSATGNYQRKYVWHTNTRERIRLLVSFSNPLPQPLCGAQAEVYKGGVLLAQDAVEWAPPGTRVQLAAGHTHEIEVDRSVDTSEFPKRHPRPFRHQIDFKVTNRGSQGVELAVVFPKKMGSRHKTLYSFKREPDRRPGSLYVWDLDLAPGKGEHISFHLDSEYPRFGDYNAYESARHAL